MGDDNKLNAFELANEIAMLVYKTARTFPGEELCELRSRLRRSAVSAPSNARRYNTPYASFGRACRRNVPNYSARGAVAKCRNFDYSVGKAKGYLGIAK